MTYSGRKIGGREKGERVSSSERALGEANVKKGKKKNLESQQISQ